MTTRQPPSCGCTGSSDGVSGHKRDQRRVSHETINLGVKGLTSGTDTLQWLDCIDGSTVVQTNVSVTTANWTLVRPASIQATCAAVSIAKQ
jgi:hypothetical protein